MRVITDKIAFVTGGASGIGLGITRRLLAHGAKVMVADLRADHLAETRELLGPSERVDFLQVDVSDRAAMAAAAAATLKRFGKIHILVNNAGVGTPPEIDQMTYADWDWVLSVNMGGTINGIMSFLPHMLAHAEGGHILSTASMAGLIPTANNFIYAASKYAVRGLSDSLRLSLANRGMRIGVVSGSDAKSHAAIGRKSAGAVCPHGAGRTVGGSRRAAQGCRHASGRDWRNRSAGHH
jgi:NADP-dependent 3-hydroxy acid dehydrogenase YdfG